mmetsp:Transcript_47423/g.106934  ORF Transcript_47423/g.106934 Transcript_47423/m.106934 type:complete len:888 (-) Transcript_47423:215-2878(-)
MVPLYLEWAAACKHLALSGQLSSAASVGLKELAELLLLAPAACLDYFDAAYSKMDTDGEYAGFTISGHLLRNESVHEHNLETTLHMPLVLQQPLAAIQIAIKHHQSGFLAQSVVHRYLRHEWLGGGTNELSYAEPKERYKVYLTWLVGWPFILLYNVILLLLVAIFPPFEKHYCARFRYQQMQPHARLLSGLPFVPLVKYFLTEGGDLTLAILFVITQSLPYEDNHNRRSTTSSELSPTRIYMYFHVAGQLLNEFTHLYRTMFDGLELSHQWASVISLFTDVAEEHIVSIGLTLDKSAHTGVSGMAAKGGEYGRRVAGQASKRPPKASTRVTSATKDPGMAHASRDEAAVAVDKATRDQLLKGTLGTAGAQLLRALWVTMQGFLSRNRLMKYVNEAWIDLAVSLLCALCLFYADEYDQQDYESTQIGLFDKEAILSYTVLLLWIKQIRLLQVTSKTGAFVYMLGIMLQDVFWWAVIYAICAFSFSASIYVLYRNQRAYIGDNFWDDVGGCYGHDNAMGSTLSDTLLFLLQSTLEGSDKWQCFYMSSARWPGLMLYGFFLVIIVLVLINTLIAMMAETYTKVSDHAFENYAFSFSRVLVSQRCNHSVVTPLNLLSLPYQVTSFLFKMIAGCRFYRRALKGLSGVHSSSTLLHREGSESSASSPSPLKQLAAMKQLAADKTQQRKSPRGQAKRCSVIQFSSIQRDLSLECGEASQAVEFATSRSSSSPAGEDADRSDLRDLAVIKKLNDIRLQVLDRLERKLQFERSVARFCRVQEDAEDPLSAEEIKDLIREVMGGEDQTNAMKGLMHDVLAEAGLTSNKCTQPEPPEAVAAMATHASYPTGTDQDPSESPSMRSVTFANSATTRSASTTVSPEVQSLKLWSPRTLDI